MFKSTRAERKAFYQTERFSDEKDAIKTSG